ncbi:MAG: 1-acyl-sn-glycerol-3-phosphate acyltransferase [Solirubrobacteraceae bacterium]|jgi:1-acyl-sn-glycerol-3-phosphate acyltransferase|nr:1-acyl-sn-glycerol-3-phosphate acyltransferase [Solirubrobacteraceae bacterium]
MSHDLAWARSVPATALREVVIVGVLAPLMDLYTRRSVEGREYLAALDGPILFVANHASHMDTPAILRALPAAWRRRTAVAAAADYFYAKRGLAALVALMFNTVPVARKGGEADATADLDRLIAQRWSLVIFAEGTRSRDGSVGKLHTGAAVLAAERELTIVPVFVSGTHQTMPVGRAWMSRDHGKRRPVRVAFGPPIAPGSGEHRTEVMDRVRTFFADSGAETTVDKRIARQRRSNVQ